MKLRSVCLAFALAAVSFSIAGCGDDILLVSLAITPDAPTVNEGSTQQFTATGTFSDSTTSTTVAGLQWTSSATTVATIDANTGLASCLIPGTSTITATAPVVSGATETVSDTTTLTCQGVG